MIIGKLSFEASSDTSVKVTRNSPCTDGQDVVREIPMPAQKFENSLRAYRAGAHIQVAFRGLSADDREFLLTGMTPEAWD